MSDAEVQIPAVCEIHGDGSGRLMIWGEGDRVMLDGRANHCGLFTLERAAVVTLFDAVTVWLS